LAFAFGFNLASSSSSLRFSSGVRQIDQHAECVHGFDYLEAKLRETGVGALHAAIPNQITRVVGELYAAHAKIVKELLLVQIIAHWRGVLKQMQQRKLVAFPRSANVRDTRSLCHKRGVFVHVPFIGRKLMQRIFKDVRTLEGGITQRDHHRIHSTGEHLLNETHGLLDANLPHIIDGQDFALLAHPFRQGWKDRDFCRRQ
jgi:hypothetical protein